MTTTLTTRTLPKRRVLIPNRAWAFKGQDGRDYVVERAYGLFVIHSERALIYGPRTSTFVSEHATLRDALLSV